jgi:NAD-dependent deacetylase
MDEALREVIGRSRRIVFFGGAGVSTESGIPDFRSAEGLYNQASGLTYPPEVVLSHSFFVAHPAEFFAYHRAHLLHPAARPNPAHRALAALERTGQLAAVITQNVDGLHQAAGSTRVLELHGNVLKNYCVDCGKRHGVDVVLETTGVPRCECGGIVRPDVVLYEEALEPRTVAEAVQEVERADTLIVGGTSLVVYPAAGLLDFFGGRDLVLLNRDPTPADDRATLIIRTPIGEALGEPTPG